ncbi:MAG: diaminopimelate epimerase [Parvularculaceae bacterium]
MSAFAGVPYRKMNGLGNDFVVLDLRGSKRAMTTDAAAGLADRTRGIGCDQVITIEDRKGPFMGVWNADGSEVGACGNATRCVAAVLMDETGKSRARFSTKAGDLDAWRVGGAGLQAGRIAVDMGTPKFDWRDIPLAEAFEDTRFIDIKLGPIDNPTLWGPSAVNMGNPHCVFFVDDVDSHALDRFGPMVENHPLFPERANVSLAQAKSRHTLRLRVWERGAGITKACGTAACAALVAACRRRLTERKATIELDGGELGGEWRDDDHVVMAGPYELDGEGTIPDHL